MIPWDEDADITIMFDDWRRVRAELRRRMKQPDHASIPLKPGEKCGCLLVDTASFGSQRQVPTNRSQPFDPVGAGA